MTSIKLIPAVACACLLFATTVHSYGQTLKADGYKIAIQKNAEHKKTNMHGKTHVSYKGFVKLNSKDTLKGMYEFIYLDMGNNVGNLSFKNKSGKTIAPKMLFYGEEGIFSYNKNDGSEGEVKREMFLPLEDIVLQGMLLWVKIKNEVPVK